MNVVLIAIMFISCSLLVTVSWFMYSILQNTSLSVADQVNKLAYIGGWLFWVGIAVELLIIIFGIIMIIYPEIMLYAKYFKTIIALLIFTGILVIIIGYQMAFSIKNNTELTDEQKLKKYNGLAITLSGISGILIGMSIGVLINSAKKN